MTQIIRGFAAFLLIAALCLTLFACNDPHVDPPESTEKETLAPPETVEDTESETAHESDSVIVYPELELPEKLAALTPSIIKLYCYDYDMNEVISHGTGFFIDDKGTFITNAHVVRDAYYVRARVYTGELYEVDVIYSYSRTASDHAICAITGYPSSPVTFSPTAELGEKVYALGYPGSTFKFYASEGEIVTLERTVGGITYIENTAEIFDGNSGGILANANGEVLGIATGSLRGGEFLAVTYSEFAQDLEKRDNPLSLFDRFHTRDEVFLSAEIAEGFFKVATNEERTKIEVSLSNYYSGTPVKIKNEPVTVSVILLNEAGEALGEPITLTFTTDKQLVEGKSANIDPSIFPDEDISAVISSASGTLVIID